MFRTIHVLWFLKVKKNLSFHFFTKQYSIVTSRQINFINKNERLMIVPFLIPSILYSQ